MKINGPGFVSATRDTYVIAAPLYVLVFQPVAGGYARIEYARVPGHPPSKLHYSFRSDFDAWKEHHKLTHKS